MVTLFIALLSALGLETMIATVPSGAVGPTVTGSGSSYAALAVNTWTQQVATVLGIDVNYQSSSSVIGLNEFAEQQIDFAASEIGYDSNQANDVPPANFPYQYLPDVGGATCLMYNLNTSTGQPIQQLKLTPPVVLAIFTGQITNWDSPQIAQINPGLALPNVPINVVFRTDASGDNYIFSDYLSTLDPGAWSAFTGAMQQPPGAQALWPTPSGGGTIAGPYNESDWIGENGSDQASGYVASQLNTMTYVETGYAIEHNKPCAYIQNASGNFVQPSELGDATALTHDQLDLTHGSQILTGVFEAPEPISYPISAYSYFVAQEGQFSPAKGNVLGQFYVYAACTGQQAAGRLGYAPIPENLVVDVLNAVLQLPGHPSVPTPLNAQTCPNPYLQGAISTGGKEPATVGGASGPVQADGGAGSSTSTTVPTSAAAGGSGGGGSSRAGVSGKGPVVLKAGSRVSNKVPGGSTAAAGQEPGVALQAAAFRMLGLSGPTGTILGWTLLLLVVLVLPPTVALVGRRRRRAQQETGASGP